MGAYAGILTPVMILLFSGMTLVLGWMLVRKFL
jgi:hypothetical protein